MALLIIFYHLIIYILTLKLWFASSHLIDRLPILYGAYDLVGSTDINDDIVGFRVCKFDV
jgi:hypothetical protein